MLLKQRIYKIETNSHRMHTNAQKHTHLMALHYISHLCLWVNLNVHHHSALYSAHTAVEDYTQTRYGHP